MGHVGQLHFYLLCDFGMTFQSIAAYYLGLLYLGNLGCSHNRVTPHEFIKSSIPQTIPVLLTNSFPINPTSQLFVHALRHTTPCISGFVAPELAADFVYVGVDSAASFVLGHQCWYYG